ncbi:MAG: hypothetical protein JNL84_00550 [Candidatus Accumulibacter sp.]|nr:hypothetical protein [Accumulibacter sp.]
MRVALNPLTGALELRDEAAAGSTGSAAVWPLELDAASGALRVNFAGLTITARPLSWREKQVLARYADHGETFLQRQLIDACCGASAAAAAPVACWTLAAWVNFPSSPGSATLPFASEAMARVTAGLCRSVGLRPTEIDALDALAVEALWQAQDAAAANVADDVADELAGRPAVGAPLVTGASFADPGEMQTIRIVADPPPAVDITMPAVASAAPMTDDAAAAAPSMPSGLAATASADHPVAVPHGQPPPALPARRALAARLRAVPPRIEAPAVPPRIEAPAVGTPSPGGLFPELSSVSGPVAMPPASSAARQAVAPVAAQIDADRSRPQPTPFTTISPLPVRSAPHTAPDRPAARTQSPAAVGQWPGRSIDPPLSAPQLGSDGSARPIIAPLPPTSADDEPFEFETLLDTFSERLDQAAVESGVDLEAY